MRSDAGINPWIVRIIGGNLSGRNLIAPSSLPVRPTTDYAKSGLFNILNNRVDFEDIEVLDLFCGAGGITFEFASRGAKSVLAVDRYPGCIKFVQQTATDLKLNNIKALKNDVFKFLKHPQRAYDIVFADPPFDLENRDELVHSIDAGEWVKPGGCFILEHPSSEDNHWKDLGETRRYGNCSFTFFQKPLQANTI